MIKASVGKHTITQWYFPACFWSSYYHLFSFPSSATVLCLQAGNIIGWNEIICTSSFRTCSLPWTKHLLCCVSQVWSTASDSRFSTSPLSLSQRMCCQPPFTTTSETFRTAPRAARGPRAAGAMAPVGTATSTWSSGALPQWTTRRERWDTSGSTCPLSTGTSSLGSGRTSPVWSVRPRTTTSCSSGSRWLPWGPTHGRRCSQTAYRTSWFTPTTRPFPSRRAWWPPSRDTSWWRAKVPPRTASTGRCWASGTTLSRNSHNPGTSAPSTSCCRCKTMSFPDPSIPTRRLAGMNRVLTNPLRTNRPVGLGKRHARTSGTRCLCCSLMSRRLKRHARNSGTSPGTVLEGTWKWILLTLDGANGLYHPSRLTRTTAQGPANSPCRR